MEKIARLCWNTNEWRRPSGRIGKSKSNDSYEHGMGFGHEEWLLDDSKNIDGYHYGFLEQLRLKSDRHTGNIYDIHLFTISPNKQKVYIGYLRNVEVITAEESQEIYKIYQKKGWINEMQQDVLRVEGIVDDFTPSFMFNIKFKFEEAKICNSNQPIIKYDSIWHRYNLMDKKAPLEFEKDEDGNIKMLDTNVFDRIVVGGKFQIDPLHKKIQNAVVNLLKGQYIYLQMESINNGNATQRVDIKGFSKSEQEWHFFEVKTMSAKRSIREAIGQILEYAHYPNVNLAKKLFIVGPEQPDEKDKTYLQLLRNKYNIPVWFRWYSFVDNKLYEGV